MADISKWMYAGAFVTFFAVTAKPVGRKIVESLDTYAQDIRRQIEQAKHLREQAQTLLASYRRDQREAESEARQLVDKARQESITLREEGQEQIKKDLAAIETRAVMKIEAAELDAVLSLKSEAVYVALKATSKLLQEKSKPLSAKELDALLVGVEKAA